VHTSPFPCAVYLKTPNSHRNEFVFSHLCSNSVVKYHPRSLRVRDIQEYWYKISEHETRASYPMIRTHFVVLVSGDVAEAVSVENAKRPRNRFLFQGSRFCKRKQQEVNSIHADFSSEVSSTHITMRFYGSLSFFRSAQLASILDIECAMVLLPKVLHADKIPLFAEWVERAIKKSMLTSAWVTDGTICAYREHTLTFAHFTS